MPKVHLSKFICGELVYDYLTGKLEPKRREVFLEYLKEDIELKKKLDKQKNALRYVGELKKVELSAEYLEHINQTHKLQLGDFTEESKVVEIPSETESVEEIVKTEEPEGRFWERNRELMKVIRRSSEAFGLALVVFAIIKVLPPEYFEKGFWFSDSELIFQEETKLGDKTKAETDVAFETAQDEEAEEIDNQASEQVAKLESLKKAKDLVPKNSNMQTPKPEPKKLAAKEVIEDKAPAKAVEYYLYRSVVYVDDMEAVSKEFLSLIEAAGAEKAGKVKLGWEKPKARYFHFHIAEKEKENIVKFFSEKAEFKLNKITHWRKTPEEKIRIIVEIRQQGQ
jgi:hypothetical protein